MTLKKQKQIKFDFKSHKKSSNLHYNSKPAGSFTKFYDA